MTTESRRGDLEVHDIANGNLFTEMYADTVLFDHSIRDWRIWEGGRWERDDRNQIQELAKITSYRIRDMAEDLGTKELQQRAAASLSMHGVRNMLLSAQSMPELSVTAAGLDANPLLFNVRNGTLELDTGVFREHRPGDRITMVAGCDYDPDAAAPEFRRCLETYWPEPGGHDRDAREFLTRCMGYCLSGLNTEKLFMLLLGTGDTGKTTFMKAVEATWGDYFRTADWSTFAQQRDGDSNKHRTDLVRLAGARIVSASEGDEGCRMSDGILKRVTGRTNIIVRDLHSKPFSMPPSFKIFLDTNHFPWFNPLDQAMWNRIVQVYFRHVISLAAQQAFRKRYGDLDQVLASEASGILNLALEGWRLYMQAGSLHVPASLRTLTDHHRQQSDPLSKFFEDCCEMDAEVEKGRLHSSFIQWARMNGEAEVSPKRFGMWMIQRGFKERKSGSFRKWAGVRLFSGASMSPTSASPFLTEPDKSDE